MTCNGTTKAGTRCKRKADGDFCQQHQHQEGEGLWSDGVDFIKRRIKAVRQGPSSAPSSRLQSFLDANQDRKIVKLELGKKPIVPLLHKALDAISFGGFSRRQKALNYDKVFHNYLLVTLDDGRVVKIEKNEVISEQKAKKSDYENDVFDIPLRGKSLSMKEMVANASAGKEADFYKYKAGSDNCQRFTADMITRNGLLPDGVSDHMHIQDAHKLISAVPGGTHLANAVTNTAAVADRVLHGDGFDVDAFDSWRRQEIGRLPSVFESVSAMHMPH